VSSLSFDLFQWVEFFEKSLSKNEWTLDSPENDGGIWIGGISELWSSSITHVVLLNLSEQGLSESNPTSLPASVSLSLQQLYGFLLQSDEFNTREKILRWQLSGLFTEVHGCVAETDFHGEPLSPSLFFLQKEWTQNNCEEDKKLPQKILKQKFYKNPWEIIENESCHLFSSQEIELLHNQVEIEKQKDNFNPVLVSGLTLSASGLEEYEKCPFNPLWIKPWIQSQSI